MTAKRVIALLFVFLLLAAGVFYLYQKENTDQSHMENLYQEVEPLQQERDALLAERNSLELDYELMMRDPGTVEILFREIPQTVFTDIYPLMRDRGIVGVLGVSTNSFPGGHSKLTVDQFNRLLMDGWGCCLIFDYQSNIDNWYSQVSKMFERFGVDLPTAIYFRNNLYSSEMDEQLAEYGFTTVITDASDGRSATVTDLSGGLWHTGAMPWNYTGVNADTIVLAHTNGANLTFTVNFVNLWDIYEKEPFVSIMDSWLDLLVPDEFLEELEQSTAALSSVVPTPTPSVEEQLLTPLMKVTTFEQAYADHLEAVKNNAALEKELAKRLAEIDERVAQLDEEIRAVYDRWQQVAGGSSTVSMENGHE